MSAEVPTPFKADRTLAAWRAFAIGLLLFVASRWLALQSFVFVLRAARSSRPGLEAIGMIAMQALFVVLLLGAHAALHRSGRFREVTRTLTSLGEIGLPRLGLVFVCVMSSMSVVWWLVQIIGGPIEQPSYGVGPEIFDRALSSSGYALGVSFLLVVSLPILEELCFRGWMQRGLRHRFNSVVSIVTPAWLFAALHAPSYSRTVYLAIPLALGLALGVVAERTRSLWPSIALHSLWNVAMLAWAVRRA